MATQKYEPSVKARWTALIIASFTMMCGYFFSDVISPLKGMLESELGWNSTLFGTVTSAYGWFNVFLLMLVLGGIILDKKGIRFTAILSAGIMVVGASVKYYAIATDFGPDAILFGLKKSAMLAAIGFAIFAVGVETAGITVSKIIVKWFKGKELALAMGLQVATARLGSFGAMAFSAPLAKHLGISAPVALGVVMLCIGLIIFLVYNVMDKKLDDKLEANIEEHEEPFRISDIKMIITNKGFWLIAVLCALFYSGVFPFFKYGPDLMVNKFGVAPENSGFLPGLLPFGTLFLTPLFGGIYDKLGKGATIMIVGSVILLGSHIVLAIPGFTNVFVAGTMIILLGVAFSLVPAAMWPSLTKIIPEKQLGSAYAVTFFIQNLIALMGIPFLLGFTLDKTNPTVAAAKAAGQQVIYDYTLTWMIFVVCSVLAVIVAFMLKAEDKRSQYGLEQPNIQK